MKQSSVFLFLVTCVVFLEGTQTKNAETNTINYPTFTGCGGVIPLFWNEGYRSANISYKEGTPLSSDEFCVWTFLAADTAGDVTIYFYENFQSRNDGIVLYTWKDLNFTSNKIPHGNASLTIDAQHFAVAFSSDLNTQSYGFNFIVIVRTAAGTAATNAKAYFSAQTNGKFTYPRIIGQENYDGDKRVSVVLHGPAETPRKVREYSLRDLDTENNCDFVDIYILWSYYPDPHYKFVGR